MTSLADEQKNVFFQYFLFHSVFLTNFYVCFKNFGDFVGVYPFKIEIRTENECKIEDVL